MRVIHAVPVGDTAFYAVNLETGETALVVTTSTKDRKRVEDWARARIRRGAGASPPASRSTAK